MSVNLRPLCFSWPMLALKSGFKNDQNVFSYCLQFVFNLSSICLQFVLNLSSWLVPQLLTGLPSSQHLPEECVLPSGRHLLEN